MKDFIHKLELPEPLQSKFLNELMYISTLVGKLNHKTLVSDYWSISCISPEFISVRDYEQKIDVISPIDNANWTDVAKVYPHIDQFFEKYNLEKFLGKINTEVWPIHKHICTENSTWSLTVFKNNVENTFMDFYNYNDKNYTTEYIYDNLPLDTELVPSDRIKISNNDIYCIDTWKWHSYRVKGFIDVFLLYPKNIDSYKSMLDYVRWAETNE